MWQFLSGVQECIILPLGASARCPKKRSRYNICFTVVVVFIIFTDNYINRSRSMLQSNGVRYIMIAIMYILHLISEMTTIIVNYHFRINENFI